jgi:hypothetical protein
MSGVRELTSKLSGEFAAAKERVHVMQQAAEERHRKLQEDCQQFLRSAQRVKDLLKPRVEAFESFLPDAARKDPVQVPNSGRRDESWAWSRWMIDECICETRDSLRSSVAPISFIVSSS